MKNKKIGRVVLVLIVICTVMIPFTANKVKGSNNPQYAKVTVYPGDTLWGIASKYNTENSDVRKVIDKIRKINKLDTAVIIPGQQLLIPIN